MRAPTVYMSYSEVRARPDNEVSHDFSPREATKYHAILAREKQRSIAEFLPARETVFATTSLPNINACETVFPTRFCNLPNFGRK